MASYQCNECPMMCKNIHALGQHKACHGRSAAYQCSLCSYSVNRAHDLKRHHTKAHSKDVEASSTLSNKAAEEGRSQLRDKRGSGRESAAERGPSSVPSGRKGLVVLPRIGAFGVPALPPAPGSSLARSHPTSRKSLRPPIGAFLVPARPPATPRAELAEAEQTETVEPETGQTAGSAITRRGSEATEQRFATYEEVGALVESRLLAMRQAAKSAARGKDRLTLAVKRLQYYRAKVPKEELEELEANDEQLLLRLDSGTDLDATIGILDATMNEPESQQSGAGSKTVASVVASAGLGPGANTVAFAALSPPLAPPSSPLPPPTLPLPPLGSGPVLNQTLRQWPGQMPFSGTPLQADVREEVDVVTTEDRDTLQLLRAPGPWAPNLEAADTGPLACSTPAPVSGFPCPPPLTFHPRLGGHRGHQRHQSSITPQSPYGFFGAGESSQFCFLQAHPQQLPGPHLQPHPHHPLPGPLDAGTIGSGSGPYESGTLGPVLPGLRYYPREDVPTSSNVFITGQMERD